MNVDAIRCVWTRTWSKESTAPAKAVTVTQALGHRHPGTASALVGGLQFGLGGLATPLAGALGGTATAMGALMSGFIVVGLAAQLWASRAGTGG